MGYLFAFSAVLCGITKGYCGKKISFSASLPIQAAFYNFIRMLICIVIGFLFVIAENGNLAVSGTMLLICVFSGIATATFAISWLMAARQSAYMLVDIACTLGVVIPLLFSNIFYKEALNFADIVGLLLLFLAAAVISSYSSKLKHRLSLREFATLMIVCISYGCISLSQKVFTYQVENASPVVFNFYTYVFASVILAGYLLCFQSKSKIAVKQTPRHHYLLIVIMAVCLFGNSLFNTLAAKYLSAAQLYPLCQGSALILSSLMAAAFFGEKLNMRLILGIILCFSGLLIMHFL